MRVLYLFGMTSLFGLYIVFVSWKIISRRLRDKEHALRTFTPRYSVYEKDQPLIIDRRNGKSESGPAKGICYLPETEFMKMGTMVSRPLSTSANFSHICTLHNQSVYNLGDEIHVTIHLHDNQGKQKRVGGDYLRLWMVSPELTASVNGKVIDYNNGSYYGRLRALWAGDAYIRVQIARRREEIGLYYKFYKHYHSLWTIHGEFGNGSSSETTECYVTPWGYTNLSAQWCNLTHLNDGFPWYCKKPRRPELNCEMYSSTWSEISATKINGMKKKLFYWLKEESDLLEPFKITVRTNLGSRTVPPPKTPCHNLPPEVTWRREPPEGFFYQGKWLGIRCANTLSHASREYKTCLEGRTLWLHGDSNSALFSIRLHSMLNLTYTFKKYGHDPKVSSDPEYNFTISWRAHEMPFYHGKYRHKSFTTQAQHVILNSLPNETRDIVVLYVYIHFTIVHPDVFRRHVQRLAQSAQKLIARAPNVTIAVRGPHAFYRNDLWLMSYWGLLYADVLHQEFSLLRKHIVYLDYWDMTSAWPSSDIHPEDNIVDNMVRNMMSMLCFRLKEL